MAGVGGVRRGLVGDGGGVWEEWEALPQKKKRALRPATPPAPHVGRRHPATTLTASPTHRPPEGQQAEGRQPLGGAPGGEPQAARGWEARGGSNRRGGATKPEPHMVGEVQKGRRRE